MIGSSVAGVCSFTCKAELLSLLVECVYNGNLHTTEHPSFTPIGVPTVSIAQVSNGGQLPQVVQTEDSNLP